MGLWVGVGSCGCVTGETWAGGGDCDCVGGEAGFGWASGIGESSLAVCECNEICDGEIVDKEAEARSGVSWAGDWEMSMTLVDVMSGTVEERASLATRSARSATSKELARSMISGEKLA